MESSSFAHPSLALDATTISTEDVEKLHQKRKKKGLCPKCGATQTHKKHLMRVIPLTEHGVVYQGICLRCNPVPTLTEKIAYRGCGWRRTVRATDFRFKWDRSIVPSSCLDFAYVRKVEFFGGDNDAVCCLGCVTLVPSDVHVIDSVVECPNGRTVATFADIVKAQQQLKLMDRAEWFREACKRCGGMQRGNVRVKVRQKHLVDDSIEAIKSFSRSDLRKGWLLEREAELGELLSKEWYNTIIAQIFSPDAGLWQKCEMDQSRMDINAISGTLCLEHLKYFRFCGRILAKSFLECHFVRPRLATHLYKLILGWPLVLGDLKELDPDCYSRLIELNEGDDEDLSGLFFTASTDVLGMTTRIPLVPNGFDAAVDRENLPEYIEASFKYRMFGRYKEQLSEFILGFYDIIPEPLIALFDFMEFEELIVGSYAGGKSEEDERIDEYRSASEQITSNYNLSEVQSTEGSVTSDLSGVEVAEDRGADNEVGVFRAGLTTAATNDRTGSAPLIEAFVVEDEPTYEAEQIIDVSSNEKSQMTRIKLGQCPTCGMETHRVSGRFTKKYQPISNKYVLSGRCLICKPIHSDLLISSTLNTSAADISDDSPVGLGLMDATVEATDDSGDNYGSRNESNVFTMNLDDKGVEKEPELATLFATSLNTQTVKCKYCLSNLFASKSDTSFTCERCHRATYLREYGRLRAEGDAEFLQGNISEAIHLYSKAVEENPHDHQSLSNICAAYLQKGDASSTTVALKTAREIVLLKTSCQRSYYNKGSALMILQRYNDAVAVFEEGIEHFPADPALTYGLKEAKETASENEPSVGQLSRYLGATPRVTSPIQAQNRAIFEEAAYPIQARHPFRLKIASGPIANFVYGKNPQQSAIVSCANEASINDAICEAGGISLWEDRQSLLFGPGSSVGVAYLTGPSDTYGKLNVPYVIHAMPPVYTTSSSEFDSLLAATYTSCLECGEQNRLEAIAFSILSVNNRGLRPLDDVVRIGMESICTFDGYPDLKEIHFIASTKNKAEKMQKAAIQLGLSREWKSNTSMEKETNHTDENQIFATDTHTSLEQKCEQKCEEYIPGSDHVLDEEVVELQEEEPPSSGSYENLDILGRLVKRAAVAHNLQFRASSGEMIPCDLRLHHPVTPSELTLDTYFRRDVTSIKNEPLTTAGVSRTFPIDHEINTTRLHLSAVVECIVIEPVQLPQNYVEMIKTDTVIGGGYFGEVRLGIDKCLGMQFAVKLIKPLVIEQALSSQLQSIQKSFQNEIKVLSRLRHPNIAPLYGYCMEKSGLENTCLLYEFAANGSLDKFWATDGNENRLSRERLSDARVRARIALEVATVLRYMHEGLGKTKCFHRDIKSANICLCSDFSVRVVDCGLAKYVTEEVGSFSTAGPTGTPGYTCPQYLQGEISFCSACDVFSLGVVICELITGRLSMRNAQHYSTYKKGSRSLIGDADNSVDWGSSDYYLRQLEMLALKCMRFTAKKRPSVGRVVNELSKIVHTPDSEDLVSKEMSTSFVKTSDSPENDVDSTDGRCHFCGERCGKYESIQCTGGNECHRQCANCLQSALRRNLGSFRYGRLSCLKDGCNSGQFEDEEVASVVSSDIWKSYSNQRSSDLFQTMARNLNRVEANLCQLQHTLVQLTAANGLPCPKLFILIPADRDGDKARGKPMEWTKNMTSVKLYLHFVCSHSLQPVSNKCRIKLRYKRDWMRAIAPALNLSLDIIKLTITLLVGHEVPIDFARIKEMDDWCKEMLDPADRSAMEEASKCGSLTSKDMGPKLCTLTGDSLSKVAEKAASSNVNWQSELVPVFDYEKKEPTFVMKEFASHHRYRRDSGIFTSG